MRKLLHGGQILLLSATSAKYIITFKTKLAMLEYVLHLSTTSMINDPMTHMHDNVVTSAGGMHISPYHNRFNFLQCSKHSGTSLKRAAVNRSNKGLTKTSSNKGIYSVMIDHCLPFPNPHQKEQVDVEQSHPALITIYSRPLQPVYSMQTRLFAQVLVPQGCLATHYRLHSGCVTNLSSTLQFDPPVQLCDCSFVTYKRLPRCCRCIPQAIQRALTLQQISLHK
jgi:hypothetical protein